MHEGKLHYIPHKLLQVTAASIKKFTNFMLLIPCMFLKSIYFPTALCDTMYITCVTLLHFQHPDGISGNYCNKGVRANLLIYVYSVINFICCFSVVYMGSVFKQQVLLHMIYPISSWYTLWCVYCQVVWGTMGSTYTTQQPIYHMVYQDKIISIVCIHYPYKQLLKQQIEWLLIKVHHNTYQELTTR